MIDVVTVWLWYVDYLSGNSNIATLLMWSVYLLNAIFQTVKWYKEANYRNSED